MKSLKITSLLFLLTLLISCSESDDPIPPKGDYEHGYFISNEGPFQNGSGSITFVGDDGTIQQNIYKSVNGEDLGNIVNSIALVNDYAYIIVNNSNKIVVCDRYNMEKIAVIDGQDVYNPRYFVAIGNTGYVSNWGDPLDASDDFIAVVDISSNVITNTIAVGEGPEKMTIENNRLFVAMEGGWSQNNQVVVIDTNNNSMMSSVVVGDVPNSLQSDALGNIWILCEGKPSWTGDETAGGLYQINSSNLVVSNFDFSLSDHPEHLTVEMGFIYYNLNGKVYEMDSNDSELPSEGIIGLDGFYYSLTAHNGNLYATDAKDYASEGELKVFNLETGSLIETIGTGIIPGDIAFQ